VAGVGPVPVQMWQRLVAAHGAHRLNPFAADFAQRRVLLGRKAPKGLTPRPDLGYPYQCLFAYVAWVMASPHALIGAILLQPASPSRAPQPEPAPLSGNPPHSYVRVAPALQHTHMYTCTRISDRRSAVRIMMPQSNR
jgi:hypothetical protein